MSLQNASSCFTLRNWLFHFSEKLKSYYFESNLLNQPAWLWVLRDQNVQRNRVIPKEGCLNSGYQWKKKTWKEQSGWRWHWQGSEKRAGRTMFKRQISKFRLFTHSRNDENLAPISLYPHPLPPSSPFSFSCFHFQYWSFDVSPISFAMDDINSHLI